MKKLKFLWLFVLLSAVTVSALWFVGGHASAFGNWLPDSNDITKGAWVQLNSGETQYVRQTNTDVRVWFTSKSGGTITVHNGNFCNSNAGDMIETEDKVGWNDISNGRAITKFTISGGGISSRALYGRKYASGSGNCMDALSTKVSGLTSQENGYYYVDVSVDYQGFGKTFDGVMNAYQISASGSDSRVGSPGNIGQGHDITADQKASSPNYVTYNAPFGTPCKFDDNTTGRLVLYDLDNSGGSGAQPTSGGPVTVVIIDKATGNPVPSLKSGSGKVRNGVWTPGNVQNTTQQATFTAKPDAKYVLQIRHVYYNNTIQYSVPFSQIYSADCTSNAQITPHATVNGSSSNITVMQGKSVTFNNWATTRGTSPADTGSYRERFTHSGSLPGADWTSGNIKLYPAGDNPPGKGNLPAGALPPGKYCRTTTVYNYPSNVERPKGNSASVCVTVVAKPITTSTDHVYLNGYVNGSGATETTNEVDFSGGVHVSNFPRPEVGGWGYNEDSQRLDAQRTGSYISNYGLQSDSRPASDYNWSYASPNVSPYRCGYKNKGTCYNYSCPSGYSSVGSGSSMSCRTKVWYTYTQYRYRCVDPYAGGWSSWGGGAPSCRNYYTCYYGASGSGWYYSAPTCQGWRCQYSDTPQYNQSTKPTCEYRCNGGYGERAYGDNGSGFQRHCFVDPHFTISCVWSDGTTTSSEDVDYFNSGLTFCQSNTSSQAGGIGTLECASITPNDPVVWNTDPVPGTELVNGVVRQVVYWDWQISAGSGCSQVIGKPYVKIYGGDTRVGGGVGVTSTSCGFNSGAGIEAYNRSDDYDGSGTQYASMAMKIVHGFASAQYNDLTADPSVGYTPGALAFSNASSVGSVYGGKFNSPPACTGYVESLPADAQQLSGNQTIAGRTVNANSANQSIHVVNGDVYISGNITYPPATWTTAAQIPQFQLVVEGNIYVSGNVTQLDGLYVAIPRNGGYGGHIYTCASGIGSVPNSTFTGQCSRQLVVNGSFAAKQVHFLRDCGSLARSYDNEPTVFSGGSDPQFCGGINRAAEVFNYTPEQWIRSSVGPTPNRYDSISSMPPVL